MPGVPKRVIFARWSGGALGCNYNNFQIKTACPRQAVVLLFLPTYRVTISATNPPPKELTATPSIPQIHISCREVNMQLVLARALPSQ